MLTTEYTITLEMADEERSDFYADFTMILCGLNFCVWPVMKLIFTFWLQMASTRPVFNVVMHSNKMTGP